MRRASAVCFTALLAVLIVSGCGRQSATRDAEVRELRERIDRVERENAEERARLAEDLGAMREDVNTLRASLDQANQHLATLTGQDPVATGSAKPGKSPRAALRQSLHEMFDASRNALDRLGKGLDKSLHRTQTRNATDAPAN